VDGGTSIRLLSRLGKLVRGAQESLGRIGNKGGTVGKAARNKAARSTPTARRTPARPPAGRAPWGWIGLAVALAATVAAVVLWQTGQPGDTSHPVALTHVHGLGINPADGTLYVATHDGLYQIPADGQARLVGSGRQDTMGFTIAGPNQFLASGHPAPGQGGPPHLGLIESGDGGVTWTTRSLAGTADFHALRFGHDTVYGYNSTTGQLITSTDKVNWQTRASLSLRDFDLSPTDPQTLLATTQTGLQRSTDGGTTWVSAGGPPILLLAWETADRLWGVTNFGDVLRSADGGSSWTPSGKLSGQVAAFAAHDGTLYASVHERGILRSTDHGSAWTTVYA